MPNHLIQNTDAEYYSSSNIGNYQFISLDVLIDQFMVAYVGEEKLISRVSRSDVQFHAQRAMQELSFDTFKSIKKHEFLVPNTLIIPVPPDYVSYTKIVSVDNTGIEHILYPTSKTSNPSNYQLDDNDEFLFDTDGNKILSGELIENGNFHGSFNNWTLNQLPEDATPQTQTFETDATLATFGDPLVGWHYGFDGNALRAYDIAQNQAVRQESVPIISGEQYTITYTISNYTSGIVNFGIVDENGDFSETTGRSENGTFTETITASTTAAQYIVRSVYIQNTSATAGNFVIDSVSIVRVGSENQNETWQNYKSLTSSPTGEDYEGDTYWPLVGERYGLEPSHSQVNGSFYIDELTGFIHFSSILSGKTVTLKYISDSLGTDGEMQVHKFAEEAMYKWISYAILSNKFGVPQYIINRLKKEKFAETRKAKLRLSNIKLEELTQILRNKSKWIKH